MRERTLSFAIITLIEKCFPTSRRNSRKLMPLVQSALLTMRAGLAPRKVAGDGADVGGDLVGGLQVALGGFAGRIADHARGAAGESEHVMAGELEAAERDLAHEMADVKRVAGRIEAAIDRERALREALGERAFVGAIGDEAAPFQVFEQVHGRARKARGPG
jgi:hypothetical protein